MNHDDDPAQGRPDTRPPWRFKGTTGDILVHPEGRILSIRTDIIYDKGADPPQRLGPGCVVLFDIPGRSDESPSIQEQVLVLATSAEVENQIRQRGGWR